MKQVRQQVPYALDVIDAHDPNIGVVDEAAQRWVVGKPCRDLVGESSGALDTHNAAAAAEVLEEFSPRALASTDQEPPRGLRPRHGIHEARQREGFVSPVPA